MRTVRISKGLDLPLGGKPLQTVRGEKATRRVGLVGADYPGLRPRLEVGVGDRVKLGQLLFTDRRRPGIRYTSPGSGTITAINRGDKRAFLSLVVELEGEEEISFSAFPDGRLTSLGREEAAGLLLDSGLWTALRARPFGRVPDPGGRPRAVFVTAMDSNPHAPATDKVLEGREKDFAAGIAVLTRLTEGKVYICRAPGGKVSAPDMERVEAAEFAGPHPAGIAGTHIHHLDPAGRGREVWHIGAQDTAAVGALFTTGRLDVGRVIALAGPAVRDPRLLKTRIGASVGDLVDGEVVEGRNRVISGSVLAGRAAAGPLAFLGRYHQQVSVVPEGGRRKFLGWLGPGADLFSVKNAFLSRLLRGRTPALTTDLNGTERAIFPVGSYEKVMPLDILPTFLLKALAVDDVEEAENLGCLELEEEDLALCTFVCPSKVDHGANLRRVLATIEKEG